MANDEQDAFLRWARITIVQQTETQLVLRLSNGEEELFTVAPEIASFEQLQAEGRDGLWRDGRFYAFSGFLVADDDDDDDLDDEDDDDGDLDEDIDEADVEQEARDFYAE